MISHLNAGPVSAIEPQPLRGAVLVGLSAGKMYGTLEILATLTGLEPVLPP
jgi:hypothetical protein